MQSIVHDRRLRVVLSVAAVLLVALLLPGAALAKAPRQTWYPNTPFERDPTWHYQVRLWEADGEGGLHELTDEEFAQLGESREQTVSVLPYPSGNPLGVPVWGIYHSELRFVLWMARLGGQTGTDPSLAQVGETAKDAYDDALTPAENDAAGNIEWFQAGGQWLPRTWTKRVAQPGQTWTEQWGPFDPYEGADVTDPSSYLRERVTKVTPTSVDFNGKRYPAVKVTMVGPSEGSPMLVATESFIFIHNIGMYSRYFDLTTVPRAGMPATMVFKHIATLQDASFGM